MAQQDINVGAAGNDGTGDDLRTAGTKINNNFSEVYGDISVLQSISGVSASGISFDSGGLRFEGSTADSNETLLLATDPTADRTIFLPDSSGTLATVSRITQIVDSAYVSFITGTAFDSASTLSLIKANSIDSSHTILLIDSDYIQLRQTTLSFDDVQKITMLGSTDDSAALIIKGAPRRFGTLIKTNADVATQPAALLVAGDGDSSHSDIIIEARGNSSATTVNINDHYNTKDTVFAVLGSGHTVIAKRSHPDWNGIDSSGAYRQNLNFGSVLDVYGDASVDRLHVKYGDSGGIRWESDPRGGNFDVASIYTAADTGDAEAVSMVIKVDNDPADRIHLQTASDSGVLINNNVILHAGNFSEFVDSSFTQTKVDTVNLRNYTVAQAPNSPPHGTMIFCTNGNSGAATLAVYDSDGDSAGGGGYFRRIALGAQIST